MFACVRSTTIIYIGGLFDCLYLPYWFYSTLRTIAKQLFVVKYNFWISSFLLIFFVTIFISSLVYPYFHILFAIITHRPHNVVHFCPPNFITVCGFLSIISCRFLLQLAVILRFFSPMLILAKSRSSGLLVEVCFVHIIYIYISLPLLFINRRIFFLIWFDKIKLLIQ